MQQYMGIESLPTRIVRVFRPWLRQTTRQRVNETIGYAEAAPDNKTTSQRDNEWGGSRLVVLWSRSLRSVSEALYTLYTF